MWIIDKLAKWTSNGAGEGQKLVVDYKVIDSKVKV